MNLSYSYRGDYIQGKFIKVTDPNGEIANQNPGNLEAAAVKFPYRFEHANEAVAAARRSFETWRRIPLSDRLAAVARYRDALAKEQTTLCQLITLEIGKPLWESRQEVAETLAALDSFLQLTPVRSAEMAIAEGTDLCMGAVRLMPRGVATILGATDIPVLGAHRHLIPVLLQGNTVVFKSSKYAPTVGQFIAHLIHEAGIPAGVVNVLHGGFELGRRLASHSDVDLVFFTGSHEKAIRLKKQILNDYSKVVVMDTGGKNAFLVWEDAHYETALAQAFYSAFLTSGQRNTNAHRILVHEKLFDRFLGDFHKMAKRCAIGYGMEETGEIPFHGPLLSAKSVENYLSFQGIAVREGCEEIMRGKPLERTKRGYYVSPSVHVVHSPNPKSVYEQSEIFGPNAAFYKVGDVEEAVEWINQSEYGLVASIHTHNRGVFNRFIEDVQVGQVFWNLPSPFACERMPQGGLRRSGNARPMGSLAHWQCTSPLGWVEPASSHAWQTPASLPAAK